jgi:hypothetical protein
MSPFPGVSIDMPLCEEDWKTMEQAKEEAADKAREAAVGTPVIEEPVFEDATDEAPYGMCHSCGEPIGVYDSEVKHSNDATEAVASWWTHLDDNTKHCHESCRCKAREQGKGKVRNKTLVRVP